MLKKYLIKKNLIPLIVLGASIILIAASFAYFVMDISDPGRTDIDVTATSEERLILSTGENINMSINLSNLKEGDDSLKSSTTTSATLIADASGSSTQTYNVYYHVTKNDLIYTTSDNKPEMLLKLTDPSGVEITNLDGLTHVTVTDAKGVEISGFDVTNYEGLVVLAENYNITTTNSVDGITQVWTSELQFVNLTTNQVDNSGKGIESKLILTKESFRNLATAILNDNEGIAAIEAKAVPDFTQIAIENNGLFATQDNYGTSYYFRGAVDDNWVYFAGFYWRIIRINGDGSVRVVYSGPTRPTEAESVVMIGSHIGYGFFNSTYDRAEYTGYMYTIGQQHGLTTDSTAKQAMDTWYENNILGTEYESSVADILFCGDRTSYANTDGTTIATGIGSSEQFFGTYIRLQTNNLPSYECPNKLDAYTVDDEANGNGALTYPIGMLTADEVVYAGGGFGSINSNNSYFLYIHNDYWLLSPHSNNSSFPYEFFIATAGNINNSPIVNNYTYRPVLSLSTSTSVTGIGTWNDPYIVLN